MLGGDDFAANTEKRWDFLSPWCEALKPHVGFSYPGDTAEYVWKMDDISLKVTMPRRRVDNEGEDKDTFRSKFHKVQESLVLLAAVEHADCEAWRYLLTEHCGVKLGQIGDELFGAVIAVKFLLDVELKGNVSEDGKTDYDLVRFFGTHQREYPSEEYLETLNRIAELDDTVNPGSPGVEVKVPVILGLELDQTDCGEMLMDFRRAEEELQNQWVVYIPEDLGSGAIRCTFCYETNDDRCWILI